MICLWTRSWKNTYFSLIRREERSWTRGTLRNPYRTLLDPNVILKFLWRAFIYLSVKKQLLSFEIILYFFSPKKSTRKKSTSPCSEKVLMWKGMHQLLYVPQTGKNKQHFQNIILAYRKYFMSHISNSFKVASSNTHVQWLMWLNTQLMQY